MKKNLSIIFIILLISGLIVIYLNATNQKEARNKPDPKMETAGSANYKATFSIYTNGTLRDFSNPKYHNKSTEIFIEAPSPNSINIHRSNTTWGDFFNTLPMKVNENCLTTGTKQIFCSNDEYSLQFFINGIRNQNALNELIKEGDKLLITYEPEGSPRILQQINSIPE